MKDTRQEAASPATVEAHDTIERQRKWRGRNRGPRFAGSLDDEIGQTIIRANTAQRDVKQVCGDPPPPQSVLMTQTVAQLHHTNGVLRANAHREKHTIEFRVGLETGEIEPRRHETHRSDTNRTYHEHTGLKGDYPLDTRMV